MTDAWVAYTHPAPEAALRLICLPCAGGSATGYRAFVDALHPVADVYPIELPGHGLRMREPAFSKIDPLVEALFSNVIAPMEPPYAFFGHSMGALVAFELARKTQREGVPPPEYLFVSAHRAPQLPNPDPTKHLLPDAALVAHLRDLEGTPPEVLAHPDLLAMVLPTLRADLTLLNTYDYVAGPRLTTPILALGGIADAMIGRSQLTAWGELTEGPFSVRQFPGGHFYLDKGHPMLMQVLQRALLALT